MEIANLKEELRRLVDGLPDDAAWDDLKHAICLFQAIEAGLNDKREGRVSDLASVRARLGLAER